VYERKIKKVIEKIIAKKWKRWNVKNRIKRKE